MEKNFIIMSRITLILIQKDEDIKKKDQQPFLFQKENTVPKDIVQ